MTSKPTKYEFTMGANKNLPIEKNQIWEPGFDKEAKTNVVKILHMAAYEIFRMQCRNPKNVAPSFQLINKVVYFKWGLWDASHVVDADFERTGNNYEDLRQERSVEHFIAEVWVPGFKPLEYVCDETDAVDEIKAWKWQKTEDDSPGDDGNDAIEIKAWKWEVPQDVDEIIGLIEQPYAEPPNIEVDDFGTICSDRAVYLPVGDFEKVNGDELEIFVDDPNGYLKFENEKWSLSYATD